MQSFRTELENPVVEKDIIDLENKIREFHHGQIDQEKFRSLRLARGVYGQRQTGVQMIRIKLPYGKLSARQLRRISDVSEEYSTGRLHITTRQDIQIHYVDLDRTPELWAELEKDNITLREACGNTVRNITASDTAGIDPEEPFDVTPYAQATFEYFLRYPVGQDLGRKFKIAFSSSDKDTALTFMHDLGFIPKVLEEDGLLKRGFKVLLGGGLGAQPFAAESIQDFLPEDQLIPFTEATLRVFDRHGERTRRNKARLKYLVQKEGVEQVIRYIREEWSALPHKTYPIRVEEEDFVTTNKFIELPHSPTEYDRWVDTNVIPQKQQGYSAVKVKVELGDFFIEQARALADILDELAGQGLRLTVYQGMLIRFVRNENLPALFNRLSELALTKSGADSTADITACPGTDTCNLGISSSTGVARKLEQVISSEYPELVHNSEIKIKISGCMNSCGQHSLASIGFHGSTMKVGKQVAPALQVLLGGGVVGDGKGRFAEKVIKLPSKRAPQTLRAILGDYENNSLEGEYFLDYYDRLGKNYFYELLKPLTDTESLDPQDFIDWGAQEKFQPAIGVGECAGVTIDLVATLLLESEEKLSLAEEALAEEKFSDSIYHSYSAQIHAAKALLTELDIRSNSQASVISLFDEHFVDSGLFAWRGSFAQSIYRIKTEEPVAGFAQEYLNTAREFIQRAQGYRQSKLN